MSTVIAFLSGKGGSGKTTLALSMADLFQKCGVRTLLIDCDMSTNGATYFFEAKLNQNQYGNMHFSSFNDILYKEESGFEHNYLKVEKLLDFMPSVARISSESFEGRAGFNRNKLRERISHFLTAVKEDYDAILFDCQAGYTEILPALLPHIDVNLFVLEADSISASAMRSLHLKIGNYLGKARLYQVFNKATPEEFEIYSKIVGTFFTNIGTLLFDWKIRQAFSRSLIPDIESTSAKYGTDLCQICKIIVNDDGLKSKLEAFSRKLRVIQLDEHQKKIEDHIMSLSKSTYKTKLVGVSGVIAMLTGIIAVISEKLLKEYTHSSVIEVPVILIFLLTILTITVIFPVLMYNDRREERIKYERELRDIRKELATLEKYTNADQT